MAGQYVQWDYLFVQIALSRGFQTSVYRPFAVNGEKLDRWDRGPDWQEYFQTLGLEGWEFITFDEVFLNDPVIGGKLAIFKRRRPAPEEEPRLKRIGTGQLGYSPPFVEPPE